MESYIPTKLIIGENCIKNNAVLFSIYGKKALLVTGKNSAKKSGALLDVMDALNIAGVSFSIYDKVENNPTIETCYEGGKVAKTYQADYIIAIGGGSPMDAAKAIATYATNEIDMMSLYDGQFPHKPLPIVSVPLTAGTGSEVTPYSVLTVHSLNNKKTFTCEDNFSKIAFLDGRYLKSLSDAVLLDTVADALSHAIESILCKRNSMVSQIYAEAALRKLSMCMEGIFCNTPDYERLLYASSLAGMAISHTGTVIVHSMGYMLTYYKNVPHGRANAYLLPSYISFCEKYAPKQLDIVLNAFNAKNTDELIHCIKKLTYDTITLSQDEVHAFAKQAFGAKNVTQTPWKLTEQDEIAIYSSLLSQ